MKQLTCEMCGSNDLLKTDDVFVCQMCGTKYSVEEAKKMMIEGTVKIDTSDKLENLYKIARRAKEENNNEIAAKYYEMILVDDPTSWEASFFSVYYKSMGCVIANIQSAAIALDNCTANVFRLIRDNVPEEKQLEAINEVVTYCSMGAVALFNGAKNHYDGIDRQIRYNYLTEYAKRAVASYNIILHCGDNIDWIFSSGETKRAAVAAWKGGIALAKKRWNSVLEEPYRSLVVKYAEKVKCYDVQYYNEQMNAISIAEKEREEAIKKSRKGCLGWGVFFAIAAVVMLIIGIGIGQGGQLDDSAPIFYVISGFCLFLSILSFLFR